MIWVYGICDRPELPLPRRLGLAQAPLDSIREGDLVAVVSRHGDLPDEPALDAMWVHERVIEQIMADRAVLPMRFGTKVEDDEALRRVLAARRHEFLATLDRVRGRVEVSVRAMQPPREPAPEPAPAATTGREYLESKLHSGRRNEHEARSLHDPLASLAVEVSRDPPRTAEELLRASYLIDSAVLAGFRGTVERLQRAHPEVAILCTGPWPPYSFVAAPAALPSTPATP